MDEDFIKDWTVLLFNTLNTKWKKTKALGICLFTLKLEGTPNLLPRVHQEYFPWGKCCWSMKQTAYLYHFLFSHASHHSTITPCSFITASCSAWYTDKAAHCDIPWFVSCGICQWPDTWLVTGWGDYGMVYHMMNILIFITKETHGNCWYIYCTCYLYLDKLLVINKHEHKHLGGKCTWPLYHFMQLKL
jgi:hypothetical protein